MMYMRSSVFMSGSPMSSGTQALAESSSDKEGEGLPWAGSCPGVKIWHIDQGIKYRGFRDSRLFSRLYFKPDDKH